MPRTVILALHVTWVALMVIFGGLIVTNMVGGAMSALFGAIILAVMGLELWGRHRAKVSPRLPGA